MKKLIEYTDDFGYFNSEHPYFESRYKVLITHDNSLESINEKFSIDFIGLDGKKVDEQKINGWVIREVGVRNYYGRAKVCVTIKDPQEIKLPVIESGGFSLFNDEKSNIDMVVIELTNLLKEAIKLSCFANYRSRLDYLNAFQKENPDKAEIFKKI